MINIKQDKVVQKFLALDMWAHRALKLIEIGIKGEKIDEALNQIQSCLHACREVVKDE